jgi:hypothetical protein
MFFAGVLLTTGCGGNKDRGKYKDKDRPQAPKSTNAAPLILKPSSVA